MPIENCVFSSGRHIFEILSVGILFLGVQHVKRAVILLLQYQSSPIQQSNAIYLVGIGNMLTVPHPILLFCPNQGCWEWVGGSATMLALWHILLYPFLTVVDGFIYIGLITHVVTPLFILIGLTLAPR